MTTISANLPHANLVTPHALQDLRICSQAGGAVQFLAHQNPVQPKHRESAAVGRVIAVAVDQFAELTDVS